MARAGGKPSGILPDLSESVIFAGGGNWVRGVGRCASASVFVCCCSRPMYKKRVTRIKAYLAGIGYLLTVEIQSARYLALPLFWFWRQRMVVLCIPSTYGWPGGRRRQLQQPVWADRLLLC